MTTQDRRNPTQSPPLQQQSRRIVAMRPAVRRYNRATDLIRLLPVWPQELADGTIAGHTRLVLMLERALRQERQRGVGGHWSYDLSRHASLMWALRAERAALQALKCRMPTGPGLDIRTAAPCCPPIGHLARN